jgi:uncharacterized protein with GYD domain
MSAESSSFLPEADGAAEHGGDASDDGPRLASDILHSHAASAAGEGEKIMATYLMLFRFTPQGMTHIQESPARVAAAKRAFQERGVEVKAFYSLMGRYDTMFLVEAPDDATLAKATLALGAQGNVHSETLRAFTEEEYRQIVAALR